MHKTAFPKKNRYFFIIIYSKLTKNQMEQNRSIYCNSYNSVDYGMERTMQSAAIAVSPKVDIYEEATTEDITKIYNRRRIYEALAEAFEKSPYYEKYGKMQKKKHQKAKKGTSLFGGEQEIVPVKNNEEIDLENEIPQNMEDYDFLKIEKNDISDIYYYFKELLEEQNFDELECFCAIAEFFKLNYKSLYDDYISIESKAKLLNALKEEYNIKFEKNNKLF